MSAGGFACPRLDRGLFQVDTVDDNADDQGNDEYSDQLNRRHCLRFRRRRLRRLNR